MIILKICLCQLSTLPMLRTAKLRAARCRGAKGCCTATEPDTRTRLRALLRETAQSVAVITSFMPPGPSTESTAMRYHGATLSSFTSIAMDPHPLVTFSLRVPSRMATSLKSPQPHLSSHMVVNILSATQASTARLFSRPDLYSEPFVSVPYSLSVDGLPVLHGSLGSLSCKVLSRSLPLHDLDFLEKRSEIAANQSLHCDGTASELFIARVVRVEWPRATEKEVEGDQSELLPLLYHRRSFTSCAVAPQS
jgi:flavin reductase (DIM6/NTAB) family NADH-FMN oxidoreductase RutF